MRHGWVIAAALVLLLTAGYLLVRCDIEHTTTRATPAIPHESAP